MLYYFYTKYKQKGDKFMSKRLTITLPDDFYNALKKRADDNLRSINNQLLYELTKSHRNTPALHYPEGVRTPLPEEKYKTPTTVEQQSQPPQPRRTAGAIPAKKRIIGGTEEDYERALANRRGYISLNESYTI